MGPHQDVLDQDIDAGVDHILLPQNGHYHGQDQVACIVVDHGRLLLRGKSVPAPVHQAIERQVEQVEQHCRPQGQQQAGQLVRLHGRVEGGHQAARHRQIDTHAGEHPALLPCDQLQFSHTIAGQTHQHHAGDLLHQQPAHFHPRSPPDLTPRGRQHPGLHLPQSSGPHRVCQSFPRALSAHRACQVRCAVVR